MLKKIKAMSIKKKMVLAIALILVLAAAALAIDHAYKNNGPKDIRNIANKNGYELDSFRSINAGDEFGKASSSQLITKIDGAGPVTVTELESEKAAEKFALSYITPAIQNTDITGSEEDLKKDGCYKFIANDFYNVVCYKDNVVGWTMVGVGANGDGRDETCIKASDELMKQLGFNVTGDIVRGKTVKKAEAKTGGESGKEAEGTR